MTRSIVALALSAALATGAAYAATLEVAVDASPAGLDPHIVTAFASFQIVDGTVYEGLTELSDTLEIVPALADAWEISEDGLTYTFTLHEGVSFHDGSAMTAEDVVASLERVLDEATGSPLSSRLGAMASAEATDDRTVVLTLDAPSAPLLSSLSTIAIVPAEFRDDTEALQQKPVGTGPFMLDAWQPNVAVRLVANGDYWREDLPQLEGVNFNIVPEGATRQVGLAGGQYHMLPNIDAPTALQLQGQPNVAMQETLELAYSLLGMNVTRAPLDVPAVREAINYAIDRGDVVDAALFGAGVPGGPLSPALENFALDTDEFACFGSDPDKARALLEEADVKLPIELTLLVLPRDDTKAIAQVVQQQLSAVGIELTLDIPEIGKFVQDWKNSEFDLFVSLNAGTIEPDDYFYRTFRSDGSTNVFKYSDPELDALLDQGRSETDVDARRATYADVQRQLACDGPAAFLTYGRLFTATREGVEGYTIYPNRSLASLRAVSIDE